MPEFDTIAKRYIEVWNSTDAARRRELIEALFTPDATYTDPLGEVAGWDGIDAFVAGAQGQFAGLRFHLADPEKPVDGHHDIARFGWHLAPDAVTEPVAIGFDVIVTADDDRISNVHGFLDKVPG
ncbi:polyketide cyclase [Prauserella marina]|uniref:SnoaL-like domain-containing protein n=1 Tax=Prauserella marina TaxID=530584 RepID=A0A222VRU3_9PSEU|nr:nuclear transport factor 2 family protein [Prauserella marina]ASR36463.1 polyketide cyclase [Prauserella marina]PWV73830.1 SnoaL-like protein [Prauserella marina]SDD57005.1 SnoaL-like domain-containing protein [Prauserella marina]